MDWIALLAALPALLVALGDHLPSLLIAAAMFYFYVQREKEHKAEQVKRLEECRECEREQRAQAEKVVAALQMVSERMAAYERDLEISAQIAGLVIGRKAREGHENAKPSGTD